MIGLCSKNNPRDVDEVIESHPDMQLKDKHITINKSNWSDKVSNFKEIEEEMIHNKCLIISNNSTQFYSKIKDCIKEINYTKKIGINAKKYVQSKSFILDRTVKTIKKYLV